jgi:hypothetical protein
MKKNIKINQGENAHVDWIDFALDADRWRAFLNLRVP